MAAEVTVEARTDGASIADLARRLLGPFGPGRGRAYSFTVPIPQLLAEGVLPAGLHDATMADVETAFGSANPRRIALFEQLGRFVVLARGFGLFTTLFVDGSFVTDADLPHDVDVVLELPLANWPQLLGHPQLLAIWDTAAVKVAYEVHLFIQPPPTPMVDFFQTMRPAEAIARTLSPSHRRGILKVTL